MPVPPAGGTVGSMTDQPQDRQPITYEEDLQDLDLDPDQRERAENDLEMPESVDDVPWNPPEQRPMGAQLLDGGDDQDGETIDQRVRQEEPEAGTAYGAPGTGQEEREERGEADMLGGDDPDAIPAGEDVLEGPA
ncbi:hypothetical protein GCM10009584_11410 [Ornithinimicrobium humiphilum]